LQIKNTTFGGREGATTNLLYIYLYIYTYIRIKQGQVEILRFLAKFSFHQTASPVNAYRPAYIFQQVTVIQLKSIQPGSLFLRGVT